MTRTKLLIAAAALAAIATTRCATTAPPPVVEPQGEDRYLVDPRAGYTSAAAPSVDHKLDDAWHYILAGMNADAQRLLDQLRQKNPDYAPLYLAEAAMEIHAQNYDAAQKSIAEAAKRAPEWQTPRVYEAEVALRLGETRRAYELYRDIARQPNAPATASERVTQLETSLYNEVFAAAQNASDADAVRLLREALTYQPAAVEPRILLARKLTEMKQYDEAHRELDPIVNGPDFDRPDVQELLAEIDVGRGRFQEAVVRYDRLARRTKDPRYEKRLEQIKEEWSSANMPPQYRQALESTALTRSDFAVLLYWTVPSVRFAQNLATPPIAVDIEGMAGREEIIRAIALGLYDVDPVTRRVSPLRAMPADRLERNLARVLTLRGASCARAVPPGDENGRAAKVLTACGVTDPLTTWPPDAIVTGRDALSMLQQVARALQ